MSAIVCWNCGASLDDVPRPISRHNQCAACFNDLHCCRLCRHYDESNATTCHEDRADPPLQKENANFCEFFSPKAGAFVAKAQHRSNSAQRELDALFGHSEQDQGEQARQASNDNSNVPPSPSPSPSPSTDDDADPRKKLDDLFNP